MLTYWIAFAISATIMFLLVRRAVREGVQAAIKASINDPAVAETLRRR